jgi:hypothetical protein
VKLKYVALILTVCSASAVAAYVAQPYIAERWYLRGLFSGDQELEGQTIDKLGEVGQEAAYEVLLARFLDYAPGTLFVRTGTQPARAMRWVEIWPHTATEPKGLWTMRKVIDAQAKIAKRLGKRRMVEFGIRELTNTSVSLRVRVFFAQYFAIVISKRHPEEFVAVEWRDAKKSDGVEYQIVKDARPEVLQICMLAVKSDDVFCRAAACYTLGFVGTREEALPPLKEAQSDSRFEVREIAGEAIEALAGSP